jgi:hypothetical protein
VEDVNRGAGTVGARSAGGDERGEGERQERGVRDRAVKPHRGTLYVTRDDAASKCN